MGDWGCAGFSSTALMSLCRAASSVLAGTAASQLMLCRQKTTIRVKSVGCKLKTGSMEKLGVG